MGETTGPRSGDGVWHHEYGNGIIRSVIWSERDVVVLFWRRTALIGPREEVFDVDMFEVFSDNFNQWMLYG